MLHNQPMHRSGNESRARFARQDPLPARRSQTLCLKVHTVKWQEYQEAVGELYEQLDNLGTVHRSVTIPDKVTGQPRQIDVLVEIQAYGHTLRMIVDAKFHAEKLDVKDVEEVLALSNAVGGSKTVIVTK